MKIISVSHLDHGLSPAHVEFLLKKFGDRKGFFLETVELPENLPELDCSLYGPDMGDEPLSEADVTYGIRGDRKWTTRFVNKPARKTRKVTVIAGPHQDEPCVLFTAYGGPSAPREPGDPNLANWELIVESREYWAKHALAKG